MVRPKRSVQQPVLPAQTGGVQLFIAIDQIAYCRIGLETAHNILIDFLWARQYAVYVIPPSIVKSSRGRFGNSGAYTDAKDAHLIADLLRTDRDRFAPWRPDSQQLMKMKTK